MVLLTFRCGSGCCVDGLGSGGFSLNCGDGGGWSVNSGRGINDNADCVGAVDWGGMKLVEWVKLEKAMLADGVEKM